MVLDWTHFVFLADAVRAASAAAQHNESFILTLVGVEISRGLVTPSKRVSGHTGDIIALK